MTAIVDIGGLFPAASTIYYRAQIVDGTGTGIPAADIYSLTLTLSNFATGEIVNGASRADILNTGRGTVDDEGNITVVLGPDDTAMPYPAPVGTKRVLSLVLDWAFNGGQAVGRHQANLVTVALTEPLA